MNQLILGLLFGVVFGFLLQKGGVAKYHVLLGVLLLEDFTVIKVMLSAIVVGMLGVFTLAWLWSLSSFTLSRRDTRRILSADFSSVLASHSSAIAPAREQPLSAKETTTPSPELLGYWLGHISMLNSRQSSARPLRTGAIAESSLFRRFFMCQRPAFIFVFAPVLVVGTTCSRKYFPGR